MDELSHSFLSQAQRSLSISWLALQCLFTSGTQCSLQHYVWNTLAGSPIIPEEHMGRSRLGTSTQPGSICGKCLFNPLSAQCLCWGVSGAACFAFGLGLSQDSELACALITCPSCCIEHTRVDIRVIWTKAACTYRSNFYLQLGTRWPLLPNTDG